MPLFTKILKLTDPMILLVTVLSKIIATVVFGFAKTPEIFYTGNVNIVMVNNLF